MERIIDNGLYMEGYHQAEKDLALTWKDIKRIVEIDHDLFGDAEQLSSELQSEEAYYKEVLKRFKEGKK